MLSNKKFRKELEELSGESFDRYMQDLENAENAGLSGDYWLPDELTDAQNLRNTITESLAKLDEAGTDHLNLTDTDARMIKTGNGLKYSFNAQIVVDSANGIIVANDVTQDACDNRQLTPMLAKVAETTGRCADVNLADSGYYSGKELSKADEMGIEVLVNIKPTPTTANGEIDEFSRENFVYDSVCDEYHCPHGGVLVHKGNSYDKTKGYSKRIYKCQSYKTCPFRKICSPKGCRTVRSSEFREAIVNQSEKQKKPENRALLKRRKVIVEPTFGNIKHNYGFRRWTVRGLANICAQWSLVCLAVNLRKIIKVWTASF